MRKVLLGLLSCLVVFFLSFDVALAKEPATPELTLNEAISMAITKSDILKKAELEVDRTKKLREEASDDLGYTPTFQSGVYMPEVETAWTSLLMKDLTWRMSKKNLNAKQDEIALKTCKAYWDVQVAQEKVSLTEKKLEKANIDLRNAKASYDVGLISQDSVIGADVQLNKAKSDLANARNDLQNAYATFNQLVGLWPEDRPKLVDRAEYHPLKINNLETEINHVLEKSPTIWLVEQQINIKEYIQDLTMATGEYRPYEVRKLEVDQAELEAMSTKDSMELLTRGLYYKLCSVEESIPAVEQAVKLAEENARIASLKYEIGMATKAELIDKEIKLLESKQFLYDVITEQAYMKLAFKKPWAYLSDYNNNQASNQAQV